MSDCLYHGRRFRTLNVLDEGCREGFAIEVDTSIPSARVIRVLGVLLLNCLLDGGAYDVYLGRHNNLIDVRDKSIVGLQKSMV